MKIKTLFAAIAALGISFSASAQSAAEISAAKSMARAYGYSDSEINAFLEGRNQTQSKEVANPSTVQDNTEGQALTVLTPAKPETAAKPAAQIDANAIYGHDFFTSNGLSIVPSYNAPAPSGYVLGPGDEVIVDVWGATVSHVVATIKNDGSINLDDLGPVYLAGMTLKSAESSLKSQMSSIYSGLSEDKKDTFIRLSIGKMKGVSVSVSGEVEVPGVYTIPSLASIPSAIFMAGGIRNNGSVRNITLFRRGKKVSEFDLYEFLFKGKFDENLRLQDGDIINVPAHGNVVSVSGAVIRGMRYELKEGETIKDVIAYAGGFDMEAQRNEVHVSRLGVESSKDFDVAESGFSSFRLVNGDKISVRRFRSNNENVLTISGSVRFPGHYALGGGITDLTSLISAAGGLTEGAATGIGQINRLDKNRQPVFVTFDIQKVLSGVSKVQLQREDEVFIFSQDDFASDLYVTISGAVTAPGIYSYHVGMTVNDLVKLAGGLRPDAFVARGQISREGDGKPVIMPFNVNKALGEDAGQFHLMRNDAVRIYSTTELKKNADISVLGEVNAPGKYTYREGMTIADAVGLAHGLTDGVDLRNVEVSRRGGRERGTVEILDLEANPELFGRAMEPYDAISFRRLTYFRGQTTIRVDGEVISPGTYVVDKAEVRLSDVMAKVGGFTEEAYVHGARLNRVLTKEEIERQEIAVRIANNNLPEGSKIDLTVFETSFVIGIDMDQAINNPGSVADVILREGDIIEVPQMNNTVKVSGGVFHPTTVAYQGNMTWKQYVKMAGGFSKYAMRGKSYAVYMNGKVAARSQIKCEPGMEIVVPQRDPETERKITPAEIASLATSATSVASLVVALTRLF